MKYWKKLAQGTAKAIRRGEHSLLSLHTINNICSYIHPISNAVKLWCLVGCTPKSQILQIDSTI